MYAFSLILADAYIFYVDLFVCIKRRAPLHPFLHMCLKNWGHYTHFSICVLKIEIHLQISFSWFRGWDALVMTLFISERQSFLTQCLCRSFQFPIYCRLVDQYWPVSHYLVGLCCIAKVSEVEIVYSCSCILYSTAVHVRLHQVFFVDSPLDSFIWLSSIGFGIGS
jgi:hypothetical protein